MLSPEDLNVIVKNNKYHKFSSIYKQNIEHSIAYFITTIKELVVNFDNIQK